MRVNINGNLGVILCAWYSSRLHLMNFKLNTVNLKCAVYREMEFHMKNYNIQGHPCGIYLKAYALALQRIKLFFHFITSLKKHYSLFSRDGRQQGPSSSMLVH